MKKILLTGLQADFDPEKLKERMAQFGPVVRVEKKSEGDPEKPWAIVEMDLDFIQAEQVAQRIDGIFYIDRFIGAHVMSRD